MKKLLLIICLVLHSSVNAQWFWQNPLPQGNDLWSVHFINSNTGWMVGEVGTILRTTDGGSTWENQVSGSKKMLRSVFFTDADNGWACGHTGTSAGNGTILNTTNGGSVWEEQTTGINGWYLSVYFTDSNLGWLVGLIDSSGLILKTIDGGQN